MSRVPFRVRYTVNSIPFPGAWCEMDLPPLSAVGEPSCQVRALHLLTGALRWIASYERWRETATEPRYRDEVVAAWPRSRRYGGGVAGDAMAASWARLAQQMNDERIALVEAN